MLDRAARGHLCEEVAFETKPGRSEKVSQRRWGGAVFQAEGTAVERP